MPVAMQGPLVVSAVKPCVLQVETAYYIHNFKGRKPLSLFRCFPGPWQVLPLHRACITACYKIQPFLDRVWPLQLSVLLVVASTVATQALHARLSQRQRRQCKLHNFT